MALVTIALKRGSKLFDDSGQLGRRVGCSWLGNAMESGVVRLAILRYSSHEPASEANTLKAYIGFE